MADLMTGSGTSIAAVQTLLQRHGLYVGPIDGVHNFSLVVAIDLYQQKMGLTPDNPDPTLRISQKGVWDATTDTATQSLVHFLSGGNEWWDIGLGRVDYDPATTVISPSPDPVPDPQPTTPSTPVNPGPPPVTQDAIDNMTRWIQNTFGIPGLQGFAERALRGGWGNDPERVENELYSEPAFQQRFPAIFELQAAGSQRVPSPREVIQAEKEYAAIMKRAGLPSGYFDRPEDFTRLIVADVSPAELSDRVMDGYARVQRSAPEVRDAFSRMFGPAGDSMLAAYFLDPVNGAEKLLREVETAAIAGQGQRFGFGMDARAGELAALGVNEQQARQGFGQLQEMQTLFQESLADTTDLTAEGAGVDAVFNTGLPGRRLLEGRRAARVGMLSGGGGAAATDAGVLGFGTGN